MEDNKRDVSGNQLYSADELRAMQKKDEESMRLAVEEVLLPSLVHHAAIYGRELADKYGAYNLYAATEGLNTTLSCLQNTYQPEKILMSRYGALIVDSRTISIVDLAANIARFTEISKLRSDMCEIVCWMWAAMKCQPNLLEDFVATFTADPNYMLLVSQTKQGRVSDPRQRWSRK